MTIDLNSPEAKEAIAAAVSEQTAALRSKNEELIGEVRKLRAGKQIDPADIEKLETRVSELTDQLKDAQKQVKSLTGERDQMGEKYKAETNYSRKLLVENGLNEALGAAGVAAPFLPFVKAKFASEVEVVEENGNRVVKVGGKALAEHVAEWSKGEDAKHFIAALPNAGGGAGGGGKGGTVKNPWAKDSFNLTEQGRIVQENPQLAEQLKASAAA